MLTPRARPTKNALKICLKEFKKRFRRVFFCPGNHDLWVRRDTSDRMYPDSIAKLAAMHNVCQEVGADMGPAEVAQGVFVVPMFSWYNHLCTEHIHVSCMARVSWRAHARVLVFTNQHKCVHCHVRDQFVELPDCPMLLLT